GVKKRCSGGPGAGFGDEVQPAAARAVAAGTAVIMTRRRGPSLYGIVPSLGGHDHVRGLGGARGVTMRTWPASRSGLDSAPVRPETWLMVSETEFNELIELLRDFIRREVMPAEAGIDETDEIPARLIAQAKEMGLYGYALPSEFGGLGLSVRQQVLLTIELGYTSPAFRSLFGTNNGIAGQVLVMGGTDEQRKHWRPRLASGEVVASFALTEPDAGSDPTSLVTSARLDGDGWVIDGLKRYITNAPAADVFMVFARTDPDATRGKGIGVFIVPAGRGVSVAARDHKMGQAGAWTADVSFSGVRVPGDALIGE